MTVRRTAEWIAALTLDDVPVGVREHAKLTLRDVLGVTLRGSRTPAARAAARYAALDGGAGGRAFQLGVAASALDLEDGHYLGGGIHPASPVFAALLTCAPDALDGRRWLAAQVAGAEVAIRVAHLLWPEDRSEQIHTTGTAGALGAAAAAAKGLGLDADRTAQALEIAWAHAPVSAFQLPAVKESIGWAAVTGVGAAQLARLDFKHAPGRERALAFGAHPLDLPRAAEDPFVTSLGSRFESQQTYFKRHSACRYTHAATDALGELLDASDVGPDAIAQIEVHALGNAGFLSEPRPCTLEDAQYSFPFVLASRALHGHAGPDEIAPERLGDARVLALAARVSLHHDPQLDRHYPDHYPARVVVRLADGRELERTRTGARGDCEDPLDAGELADKFTRLATPVLGASATARASALCLAFETAGAAELRALLADVPELQPCEEAS
jgi:2-methylcitrate dehydratase PrpD